MSKLKEKADIINEKIGAVFIAMHRDDTPLYAKIACGMCVYYALSPIDLVPDFIPVLGYLDDFIILPFLMWLSVKLMPEDILNECTEQAKEIWKEGGEKKKRYAIPILIIWAILAFWVGKTIYNHFI